MTVQSKRVKRLPEVFRDNDGTECVRIALRQPGQFAVLDLEDATAWTEAGLSWQWGRAVTGGQVMVHAPGLGPVSVARLLLAATEQERVTCEDGDLTNLRRANIRTTRTGSSAVAVETFRKQQEARRAANDARAVQP